MQPEVKAEIERILGENRILTVATNRHDGYPQATIVAYANDGLVLYFFIDRQSQKATNIAHDPRVSIAIGKDNAHPLEIKALSMSASALLVEDETEMHHAARLLMQRYPEYRPMPPPDLAADLPRPRDAGIRVDPRLCERLRPYRARQIEQHRHRRLPRPPTSITGRGKRRPTRPLTERGRGRPRQSPAS